MSDEPPRFDPASLAELPDRLALGRLPAGRHSLPRSFILRHQRLRIIAAMLRSLSLYGYAGITIDHLTREAGVSRTAFYGQFAGKEECFLATYDLAGEWLCAHVAAAVDADGEWPERVRDGVSEVLRLLAANPALARLIAVEALAAGPAARERQQVCLAQFAETLRAGRPPGAGLPIELEEMLLGGVIATIGRYVDAGQPDRLPETTEEVVQYLLIPYLGLEETQRITRAA